MIREFKIALSQEHYSDVVYLSQYDANYNISFTVMDKYAKASSIDGYSAKLMGVRSDGLGFQYTSTASGYTVPFTIDTALTALAGTCKAEVVFYDENDLYFGSANIQIVIEAATHTDDTVDADVTEQQTLLEEIQEVVDNAAASVTASVGTLTDLTTDDQTSTVAAINEVDAHADTNASAITQLSADITANLGMSIPMQYVSGAVDSSGGFITNTARIRSYATLIKEGDYVESDGTYSCLVRIYTSITNSTVTYYGVTGDFTTDRISLSAYVGKYAVIVAKKVGHESDDISDYVSTIGNSLTYNRTAELLNMCEAINAEQEFAGLTDSDFLFASISSSGVITWLNYSNGYGNALTKEILTNRLVIIPTTSTVMFRIVYYDTDDTWVSNSAWYSKDGTSVSTATNGIEVGNVPYRIMIACTSTNQNKSISELLDGFEFSAPKFGNPLIPFSGYLIDAKLEKVGGKYRSYINPYDYFIANTSGVVVFLDPDGSDSNDGLTVLTPKKTFASALAVTNVNTIILAEGTYTVGTHFTTGVQITQAVNIIGVGDVVIDNGTSAPIYFFRSVFCENVHFKGGDNALVVKLGAYDRIATFYHCVFSESSANNGLSIYGGVARIIECEAYGNAYDGFNYHAYNSILNHAIEVDCKSYGNGTTDLSASAGQSSNATTTHDGSYIVRVNGEYECCHGGIVADKASYSANYGCSAGVSTVTDSTNYPDRMSNYWCSGGYMWLYGCASFGSMYDTAVVNSGVITADTTYSNAYSA